MALETLKGLEEIGGFKVIDMDDLRERFPEKFNPSGSMDWQWFETEIRPHHFIYVRHDKNSLAFTIQNGPVKEAGVNGCQVDTVIAAGRAMLVGLNEQFPCDENKHAIQSLNEALMHLDIRRRNREDRGVEGSSAV